MRCASFPRRYKRVPRSVWLALSLAGPLLAAHGSTWAAGKRSFVYCLNQGGAKVFAGKTAANGSLAFGLSVWSPAGHNISVFGIAPKRGRAWRYTEHLSASTAAERCRLDIARYSDGRLRVTADPNATCQSHGGVNVEIGTVEFPRAACEGPVTTELEDPEAFQKAGKCVETKN